MKPAHKKIAIEILIEGENRAVIRIFVGLHPSEKLQLQKKVRLEIKTKHLNKNPFHELLV